MNTLHIWHDTPEGRKPFTYFVFGPYKPFSAPEWDVEICEGHITDDERTGANYVTTVSSLPRDTHIVIDVWTTLDRVLANV